MGNETVETEGPLPPGEYLEKSGEDSLIVREDGTVRWSCNHNGGKWNESDWEEAHTLGPFTVVHLVETMEL